MKVLIYPVLITLFIATSFFVGCAEKSASNSSDAIQQSKLMASVEEQANYLLEQAKILLSKSSYEEAIKTAQYVIENFKDKAPEAQKILAQAQEQLQKVAQQKMTEAQGEVNKTMNDVSQKLGSMGK